MNPVPPPATIKLRRRIVISIAISLLVSIIVIAIFFKPRDFAKILELHPWVILESLALVLLSFMAGGARLWRLGRINGEDFNFLATIRAHTLGLLSAAITPSGSGNAPAIALSLQQDGCPASQAWSIALYTSVIDMLFYIWAIPCAYFFLRAQNYVPTLPWLNGGLLIIFLLFIFLSILIIGYSQRLLRWAYRLFSLAWLQRFRYRTYRFLYNFIEKVRTMAQCPWRNQLELQVSTTIMHLSMFTIFWLLAQRLYFSLSLPNIWALFTLLLALSLFIPTPGGSGFFEAALALSFRQEQALVAPVVVLWRLLSFYSVFIIAPLLGMGMVARVLSGAINPVDEKSEDISNINEPLR